MKKKLTVSALAIAICLGYFLTNKIKNDIQDGTIKPIAKTKTIENVDVVYKDYEKDSFPLNFAKYFIDFPEVDKKNDTYIFKNEKDDFRKSVYKIKGDSYAMSYTFGNPENNQINKNTKSKFFKMSSAFLDKNNVKKIYRAKTSNVMLVSYIVEFEKEVSVSEIFGYTSQIINDSENNSNVLKEIDFLNQYVNWDNKYKRVNLTFSNNQKGFVLRNLVSEKLEDSVDTRLNNIVYRK